MQRRRAMRPHHGVTVRAHVRWVVVGTCLPFEDEH